MSYILSSSSWTISSLAGGDRQVRDRPDSGPGLVDDITVTEQIFPAGRPSETELWRCGGFRFLHYCSGLDYGAGISGFFPSSQ